MTSESSPNRIIHKNSLLMRGPRKHEEKILQKIEDSGQLLGKYGNYDCVSSVWPASVENVNYSDIWTFFDPKNTKDVLELSKEIGSMFPKYYDQSRIDLIPTHVLMIPGHDTDTEKSDFRKTQSLYITADIPWKDRTNFRESMQKLQKRAGCDLKPTVWEAEGYFRPLEGSKPYRGYLDKIEKVLYMKALMPLNYAHAKGGANIVKNSILSYEIPVITLFGDHGFEYHSFSKHLLGVKTWTEDYSKVETE